MSTEPAIIVKNLTKEFIIPHKKSNSLKQVFVNLGRKSKVDRRKVLKDISFEIKKGEFFGIVGRNGCGKSTLLKLLAGVYTPTKGSIIVNGSLTPFIELGVGFNPELTGRENVFLNGALLGFTHKQMHGMYQEIVDFAELQDFMDQKLKNYSSGMQVRLAFSIAIRAKSDILLLDEVLAVGDALFQKKCYDYFKQFKKEKRTVVFVSHDTSALQEYCNQGILIEKGKILQTGAINGVINKYTEILNYEEGEEKVVNKSGVEHVGSGEAKILNTMILASTNSESTTVYTEKDRHIFIGVNIKAFYNIDDPIYGLTIYDSAGQRIFAGNNLWSQKKMKKISKNEEVLITWTIPNIFSSGTFRATPAIAASGGTVMLDQVEEAVVFKVRKRQISNAQTNLEYRMDVN